MEQTELSKEWASTMKGHVSDGYVRAHQDVIKYTPVDDARTLVSAKGLNDIHARLEHEKVLLSPSATFSSQKGNRRVEEIFENTQCIPIGNIVIRTCFERDRDRIEHSKPFRRLAGKTQVHLNPSDHQRTRLTHALEVAQIASALSDGLNLNTALTRAIALGHDCGHGPGGHASEEALGIFLPEGFRHAIFGADVTLTHLNLCEETLDGIRNHSWSLNTPKTPEGELVAFADRIAYVCHDLEDALSVNMITTDDFPKELRGFLSLSRAQRIDSFIRSVFEATLNSGTIAMTAHYGEILSALRLFNMERIYHHPQSQAANDSVVKTLRELVETYQHNNELLPENVRNSMGAYDDPIRAIVEYVAGMTDDYAYRMHGMHVQQKRFYDPHTLFTF